jgi:DNA polymerase I-like protein with 3'-5' exonuclease and polymerase domains
MSDQSQLEIRVLAAIVERYYGDPTLANAYREGRDIHRYNASKVFNKPEEEIVDAERRFSKTICNDWSSINGVNCWNTLRALRATA